MYDITDNLRIFLNIIQFMLCKKMHVLKNIAFIKEVFFNDKLCDEL